MLCYCCSNQNFSDCCQPLIHGDKIAETPEQLMRSRYTAFATNNLEYIINTTDPQTRHLFDFSANKKWAEQSKFIMLKVFNSSLEKNKGIVEFEAHYSTPDSKVHVHKEKSKFRNFEGKWYYREGKII